jgi:hypothetical protein
MSMPPEPPKRLAEILLEILALSGSKQRSESESVSGNDESDLFDAHGFKEQPQPRNPKDNNEQMP